MRHPASTTGVVPVTPSALGLAGLMLLAWGGVVFGSFQYDDYPNILTHPATLGGSALVESLVGGIRPLTRASYALDHAIWGTWAGGWLITNLLLHIATALGVARLAHLRGATGAAAWLAAAVFALQPAHGMTVAYVTGRSSGLMTALLVGSLLAYESAKHEKSNGRPSWPLEMLSWACFAGAFAAKEVALCFPALLLLWEGTRSGVSTSLRSSLARLTPFVLLAAAALWIALANARYQQLLAYSVALRSPLDSVLQNAAALPLTLSLLVRPWALSVQHAAPSAGVSVAIGAVVCAVWVAMAIRLRRRSPWWTLGMLWPVIALLPTHSLIAKADAITESSLYLAWVGPSLALGLGFGRWSQRARFAARPFRACLAAVLLVMSLGCTWRAIVWGDPVRLWREAVAEVPHSSRAWNNLGMAYMGRSARASARAAFEHALRLEPSNVRAALNLSLLDLVH